ncbi:Bli1 protein [Maudiozyma humilis]|uniref:Biogenesis of lysosome-related organelles complex 1 subunit BLI1 n=1 Tax=Maudiozyma humilis TaxID=51915 RepID=A0AAV5RSD4_MAUHU|nr:Bli1 protein [Kazachstania humilis]
MTERNDTERANRRKFQKDIENCVHVLQEGVDTEAAEAISTFGAKTASNEKWAATLAGTYQVKSDEALEQFERDKEKYISQVDELESKVQYLETLCNEVEELGKELEIKSKVERRR